MERLCLATVFVYVGDVLSVESPSLSASAREALSRMCSLVRFEPPDGKAQCQAASIRRIGADIALGPDDVRARLPERLTGDMANDIRKILAYSQLRPGRASKFAGAIGVPQ